MLLYIMEFMPEYGIHSLSLAGLPRRPAAEGVSALACTKGPIMPINDNDSIIRGLTHFPSEAHGHAALLLVESLIHGMCEASILTTDSAVEIAERAISVQFDEAEAADGAGTAMWQSHTLLSSIAASLKTDRKSGPPLSP